MTATRLRSIGELFDWAVHVALKRGGVVALAYVVLQGPTTVLLNLGSDNRDDAAYVNWLRSCVPWLFGHLHPQVLNGRPHFIVEAIGLLSCLIWPIIIVATNIAAKSGLLGEPVTFADAVRAGLARFGGVFGL